MKWYNKADSLDGLEAVFVEPSKRVSERDVEDAKQDDENVEDNAEKNDAPEK